MNKKSLKFIIGGLLIVGIITAVFASVSSENLTYYHTPEEILANPQAFQKEKIRVMGLVEKGSLTFDPKQTLSTFRITEDGKLFLNVSYQGSRPDMFKEGQGVVVEGIMSSTQLFTADSLLVKHSEEYKAEEHETQQKDYYNSMQN
ncbi:MAG: cytochrome c biogenesis protein CcmE [SAR324 cluster bacterium]|uniref:Cytochrome c biogenesis protein CcmE n=1 Tax=SAR324 cluster bacterium TaxID=2024889 RepID=A0A2A4T4E2_9DELT|nr:MAG: cytochrome c biogenesis protein CcmE [SAR324 cluster bacterium]